MDRQPLDLTEDLTDRDLLQSGSPRPYGNTSPVMVMLEVKLLHPEWDSVPYQVKRTSSQRRLPRHVATCKTRSTWNSSDMPDTRQQSRPKSSTQTRLPQPPRNPRQSCYIPDDAVTEHGVYHTILGPLRMAEAIPAVADRNADWCRSAADTGSSFLTRRNATLRPHCGDWRSGASTI